MNRAALAGVLLVTLALAGCAASAELTPTLTGSSAAAGPLAEPSASPTLAASTVPAACTSYTPAPVAQVAGGEAIAAAIARAELPAGVILNPGVQTIASTDKPGMIEVVARVCSTQLERPELLDVANAIAVAAKADASSEMISLLLVSSWMPGADGMLTKGDTVRSDFQLYTWNPAATVPLSNNWK